MQHVVKVYAYPLALFAMRLKASNCQVAFVNGDRLLGEEAAALKARYPDRVYSQARSLLGLPLDKDTSEPPSQVQKLQYAVAADKARGAAQIRTHTGEDLVAEELVVSLKLSYQSTPQLVNILPAKH